MVTLVIFYEKPFCAANAKQKVLLRQSGCTLIQRNLLEHGLDSPTLRSFMGDNPIVDWFNPAAPAIKNGEIFPETLDEASAMELLMAHPILIRRPLMVIGNEKLCGFDAQKIAKLLKQYVQPMPKINCIEKGCLEKKGEITSLLS
jgi:nitrogenase-associated protein